MRGAAGAAAAPNAPTPTCARRAATATARRGSPRVRMRAWENAELTEPPGDRRRKWRPGSRSPRSSPRSTAFARSRSTVLRRARTSPHRRSSARCTKRRGVAPRTPARDAETVRSLARVEHERSDEGPERVSVRDGDGNVARRPGDRARSSVIPGQRHRRDRLDGGGSRSRFRGESSRRPRPSLRRGRRSPAIRRGRAGVDSRGRS